MIHTSVNFNKALQVYALTFFTVSEETESLADQLSVTVCLTSTQLAQFEQEISKEKGKVNSD